jgi:ATP-binding protein involved in chromosome partitioning
VDPRPAVVERRLAGVRRVVAVTGGKGGIGKSVVSTVLALTLAERGLRAGLMDLDLTSPSDHVLLGIGGPESFVPDEPFGIDPAEVGGVRLMSLGLFAGGRPAPLRGRDVTDAILELLAVTRWGELDVLVLDLPPGLSDAALDTIRLLPRAEYVAVATASCVVLDAVARTLRYLGDQGARLTGVAENMARASGAREVRAVAATAGVPFLGSIPWDEELEAAVGSPARLRETRIAAALREIAVAIEL